MFNSLWSRILLVVVGIILLTALSITFFAQRSMEKAVFSAEDQHAVDLLSAVVLNVQNEYHSLLFHRQSTLAHRKSELKNIVTLAIAHINQSYEKYQKGLLTEQQAKREALEEIRLLRYDEGVGYLWVNNLDKPLPRMLMHPVFPEIEGALLEEPRYFTALGIHKHVLGAMAEACERDGEGYVDYLWPKPAKDGPTPDQPKLSYVRLFKEWGWVVGTGVYIDDIERDVDLRLAAIIQELRTNFARVKVARSGYLFLFTGGGEMLIHPSITGRGFADLKNPESGKPIFAELIKASKTPPEPFDYTWDRPDKKGDYSYKKRAYVTHFDPLNWYIASTVYIDEIAQPAEDLRLRIILITLISIVIAVLLSIALSKNLTAPLRRLVGATEHIERMGLETADIPIGGTVETRQLGTVLSRMVGSIRKAIREKEDAIEALVRSHEELAKRNLQLAEEIGERRHAQDLLKKAHNLLEQRVEQRTAELARTNLLLESHIEVRKNTERELRETNRELDVFVYTVSHDLRNPLGAIIGAAGYLLKDSGLQLDNETIELLGGIDSEGRRMLELLEDLLAMAKVGQLERPEHPVALDKVVAQVIQTHREQIAAAGVQVTVTPLPTLRVPRSFLTQLFDNLIGNALRYASPKGGTIEIEGEQRDEGVVVAVRDHGPGIPEAERGRIFEVFYRGSTGKGIKGTGIGLATVQKIARCYGGRAWVEETPGGGSTFKVEMRDLPSS